jgi:CRISPR-associated endonuclease Cas1
MNSQQLSEPLIARHGVITLFGYGASISVDRGHLVLEDRIGPNHRSGRFAKIGHRIKRVVAIGAEGSVSLAALRWLADQDAAFVMLNRDGTVLTVTGPVGPSDARLRRSQSLAHQSGASVRISRELIFRKLDEQERLIRDTFCDPAIARTIACMRVALSTATTIQAIRQLESQAAQAYWSAWRTFPINFPTADVRRVPEHWQTFGTRKSPLTGSPRLAVNPANAMLNYMYALLESEARLAAVSLGLDPGIGFLHVDTDARDSLACDLMEPSRPCVDAFLLKWITSEPLRREWFFEQRDGNCRLMASFAERLSETLPSWRQNVGPMAEWVSHLLWSTIRNHGRLPATHLTQTHRRQAKGISKLRVIVPPRPAHLCRTCGAIATAGHRYCAICAVAVTSRELIKGAEIGRIISHSAEAESKRAETRRRHVAAQKAWLSSNQPAWLDEETYRRKIQPHLTEVTVPTIRTALGVSNGYATNIRSGKREPHPRHWQTLARLVGILRNS